MGIDYSVLASPAPWLYEQVADSDFSDPDIRMDPAARFWIADGRSNGEVIAFVLQTRLGEQHKNAALMAAAPELLSTVKVLVECFGFMLPAGELAVIGAVIADAEGRS